MSWMIPRPIRYMWEGLYYPQDKSNEMMAYVQAAYHGLTAYERTENLIKTTLRVAGLGCMVLGQMTNLVSEGPSLLVGGIASPPTVILYGSCKVAILAAGTLLGANTSGSLEQTLYGLGYTVAAWGLAEIHDFKITGTLVPELMKNLPGERVIEFVSERCTYPLTRAILKGK